MNSLQCPTCKQNIDSDSLFCDQCGEKILICSQCGRAGKGKRCVYDGKPLVEPGGSPPPTDVIGQQPPVPQPVPPQPVPQPAPQPVQQQSAPAVASGKLKLTSNVHGIVIETQDGDILGRSKGTFAAVLGRFSYISGSHCFIRKAGGVWTVVDNGSTNGTFYNGAKLNPNMPMVLTNGSKLKLADVEFVVSFDEPNDSGATDRL